MLVLLLLLMLLLPLGLVKGESACKKPWRGTCRSHANSSRSSNTGREQCKG